MPVPSPSSLSNRTRFRRAASSMDSNDNDNGCDNEITVPSVPQEPVARGRGRQRKRYGEIISALSNFSIQYNLGVISPALLLLDHCRVTNQADNPSLYPLSSNADSLLKSAVFLGAILGQSSMGFIGEALCGSLHLAMLVTNGIALLGTLGSTLVPLVGAGDFQRAEQVYTLLAVFRAILGFGVGGKYPLGSAIRAQAAESDVECPDKKEHRAKEVAKGFFWQTPGAIMPFIVQWALLLVFGDEHSGVGRKYVTSTNKQYVILVGLGAIPSIVMIFLSWQELANDANQGGNCPTICRRNRGGYREVLGNRNRGQSGLAMLLGALRNREHLRKLVGTGVSWALYDFVYYGTAFNQPEIISTVLGDGTGLVGVSWRDALIAMMGIPGVVLAIQMMETMGGPKPLQGWGFVMIGIASLNLLIFYASRDLIGSNISKWGGFVSCALLICALNWGCNVSTYVMPMEVFPREVRSSMHGLSAGMGKAGALLGCLVFTQLNQISVSLTFAACVIACCLGVLVTWRFVEPPYQNTFFADRYQSTQQQDRHHEPTSEMEPIRHEEII